MILLQNVVLSIDTDFSNVTQIMASYLKIEPQMITTAKLYKKSVDARDKGKIVFCCAFLVEAAGEEELLKRYKNASLYTYTQYQWKKAINTPKHRPIVVGAGPAGLFAAYTLATAGLMPIVIERGMDVDTRVKDVSQFWNHSELNQNSNVQFGEGGAGTFSDGKLNTGIKDSRIRTVLEVLAQFGADSDILTDAKPHIGTDVLVKVVKNMRQKIISLGGEFYFGHQLHSISVLGEKLNEITCKTADGEKSFKTEHLILAIGNAARDTFELLLNSGIQMEAKPFAVGVRIEHKQILINRAQYGSSSNHANLPPADYKLAVHLTGGRGVYTFCMCPGGVVVNGASEPNSVVTNGMSYRKRNGENANSALLVGVTPADFGSDHPLAGIAFQREIERKAYEVTGGYNAPAQTVGDFLDGKKSNSFGVVKPSIKPSAVPSDLRLVLPDFITNSIAEALPLLQRRLYGFLTRDAVMTAPETRSSSPVRIIRNDAFCSNILGIYPCGEGAGYAGGITSSSVDGIKTAEAMIDCL